MKTVGMSVLLLSLVSQFAFADEAPNEPVKQESGVRKLLDGNGSGGGGDKVEPRFINAKKKAVKVIQSLKADRIGDLSIGEVFKDWLKATSKDGLVNLHQLQFYISKMELSFRDKTDERCPHTDDRGVGYDDRDPNRPIMCIQRSENEDTSPEEAFALIVHEAGHFVGQSNHLFLSTLGSDLSTLHLVSDFSGNYYSPEQPVTDRWGNKQVACASNYHLEVSGLSVINTSTTIPSSNCRGEPETSVTTYTCTSLTSIECANDLTIPSSVARESGLRLKWIGDGSGNILIINDYHKFTSKLFKQ